MKWFHKQLLVHTAQNEEKKSWAYFMGYTVADGDIVRSTCSTASYTMNSDKAYDMSSLEAFSSHNQIKESTLIGILYIFFLCDHT